MKLFNEKFEVVETIGGTPCSSSYRAKDTVSGQEVFIKHFDAVSQIMFYKELVVHLAFREDELVSLLDFFFESDNSCCLVFKYYPQKDWRSYASNLNEINNEQLWRIIIDVVRAIASLHSRGYVHGDIKPDNILIDIEQSNQRVKALLADLGCADKLSNISNNNLLPLGTHYYQAPEVVWNKYTKQSDLFSLGMCIYSILLDLPGHKTPRDRSLKLDLITDPLQRDLVAALTEENPYYRVDSADTVLTWISLCRPDFVRLPGSSVQIQVNKSNCETLVAAKFIDRNGTKYLVSEYPQYSSISSFTESYELCGRKHYTFCKIHANYSGSNGGKVAAIGVYDSIEVIIDHDDSFSRKALLQETHRIDHISFNDDWLLCHSAQGWHLRNLATGELEEYSHGRNYLGEPLGAVMPNGNFALSHGSCNDKIEIISMSKRVAFHQFEGMIEQIQIIDGCFFVAEKSMTGPVFYKCWFYDGYTPPTQIAAGIPISRVIGDGQSIFFVTDVGQFLQLGSDGMASLVFNFEQEKEVVAATCTLDGEILALIKDKKTGLSELTFINSNRKR